MERNEWIVNYLKGKEVKKVDLENFFTIENEEKPRYIEQNKNGEQKLEYSSFTDFYKQYGQTE